jgi:hypothetical protein
MGFVVVLSGSIPRRLRRGRSLTSLEPKALPQRDRAHRAYDHHLSLPVFSMTPWLRYHWSVVILEVYRTVKQ